MTKQSLKSNKSGKLLTGIAVMLSLVIPVVLVLFPDLFFDNIQNDKKDENSFKHRVVNDRLSITFTESVTLSQAKKIAKQSGFEVMETSFTDVVLKAELENGWTESTINAVKSLPGVVNIRVISWKTAFEHAQKDDPPTYGLCYVKSRKKELIFVHFENGTTKNEIRTHCDRLGQLEVLEIQDSPNDLVISCSQQGMKDAVNLFEKNSKVKHVAFLSELVQ